MSRLITRIKSHLSKIQKDGFISSIQTLASAMTIKTRIGVAATTTVAAYLMNLAVQDTTDKTENMQNLDQHIYNLDNFVKKRAREIYKREGKTRMFRKEDLRVIWDNVEFISSDEIHYTRCVKMKEQEELHHIFKTVFKNDSKLIQKLRLQGQRETRSGTNIFLTAGFSMSSDFGLRLPLPSSIAKTGKFIQAELKISNPKENSTEERVKWKVEDVIKIPGKSTVTAEVKTIDIHREYEFRSKVGLKGKVIGQFYGKDQQILFTSTMPIGEIITSAIPKDMRENIKAVDYIKIKGKVKYFNNVEHDIMIK